MVIASIILYSWVKGQWTARSSWAGRASFEEEEALVLWDGADCTEGFVANWPEVRGMMVDECWGGFPTRDFYCGISKRSQVIGLIGGNESFASFP